MVLWKKQKDNNKMQGVNIPKSSDEHVPSEKTIDEWVNEWMTNLKHKHSK